jgi:hypothetical protein
MPVIGATLPARQYHTQQLAFLRRSFAFNTPLIGTAGKVPLGTLPANSIVTEIIIKVTTAFNAATTNVITVGTAAVDNSLVADGDFNEGVIGTTISTAQVGFTSTTDTQLFIKYAQTGTAATAGAATVIVMFVPNTDL